MTESGLAEALREMAAERGAGKTFCPSELARRLEPVDWRRLMPEIRAAAGPLVRTGELRCTQRGEDADPETARGPIRLSQSFTAPNSS